MFRDNIKVLGTFGYNSNMLKESNITEIVHRNILDTGRHNKYIIRALR